MPAAQAPTTCGVRCEAPLERSSRWTPTCPPPPFSKTRVLLSVQVRVPRCRCSRGREDGAGAWPPLPPAAPRWPAAREAPLEQVGGFAPSAGGRGPGQTCPRPPSAVRSGRLRGAGLSLAAPCSAAPGCRRTARSAPGRPPVPAWSVARVMRAVDAVPRLCVLSPFRAPGSDVPRDVGAAVPAHRGGAERSSDRRLRRGFARRGS